MKKAVLIIFALAAVIGVSLFLFLKPGNNSNPVGPNINNENSGDVLSEDEGRAAKVVVEAIPVKNKTDNIDVECTYPAIRSFSNKEFENNINKQIATNINEYRTEINYVVDDLTPEINLYKYRASYEKFTWGDYLTLVVSQDYQTGGIRSNTWKDIYNINVLTERIIYLSDLFEATTDYESAIIYEVTKQAEDKGYKLMGGDGLKKIPTYQKFYIKDGTLFIYFDPSEVAGAVYGALEFEMPFTLNSKGYFEVK